MADHARLLAHRLRAGDLDRPTLDGAADHLVALLAERDAARQALEMLWAHYLLPISDEQKAQVRAALVAVPDTEKGAEQEARSTENVEARGGGS